MELAQVGKGGCGILQASGAEDVALARFEGLERLFQDGAAIAFLVFVEKGTLVICTLVFDPFLPRVSVFADRRLQGEIARGQPRVHHFDFTSVDIESSGDFCHLFRADLLAVDGAHLLAQLAQVEEQLFLRGGRADLDQRPRTQHIILNRSPNPPHGVGRQSKAALRIETPHRLQQSDIAFRDKLCIGQSVAAIAGGDLRYKTQVREYQTMRRFDIFVIDPTACKHVLFLALEQRHFSHLCKIALQPLLADAQRSWATRDDRQTCFRHEKITLVQAVRLYRNITLCQYRVVWEGILVENDRRREKHARQGVFRGG